MRKIIFAILVLALLLLAGCGQKEQPKPATRSLGAAPAQPSDVEETPAEEPTEDATTGQAVVETPKRTNVAEEDKYYCTPDDRKATTCIKIEMPVCADSGETYVNSCLACMDSSVSFITKGAC